MANRQHVAILGNGVTGWNEWRRAFPTVQPDLRRAELDGADLRGANLSETRLSRARLRGAHLEEADLYKAHLYRADLEEADLYRAHLVKAHLDDAHLRGADLRRANLNGAQLVGAHLAGADLFGANLCGANLSQADLTGSILVNSSLASAILDGCRVYGASAWNVQLDGAIQTNLRITPLDEPNITADNLEVAQFLYLLLHNHKVRAVLDTISSKVVLILGRFGERKVVLDALREALRQHPNGYIPVLFDFEPQHDKPVLETVKTLANLARFIIADLTDPRMVRAELTAILPHVPTVPVQSIIQGDTDLPTEYGSWAIFPSFLPVSRYADLPMLLASLTEAVIVPVEEHVHARRITDADRA